MNTVTRSDVCDCRRAAHQHGQRVTYVIHKCRCDSCREATTKAERDRNRAKLYGRYDKFVDGDTVRAHLRGLMAQGMGWKRICRTAGVACSTGYAILYGKHLDEPTHPEHRPPRIKVSRLVAEKLLAVTAPQLADGAKVDATGTRRRIQALVACGWSLTRIATRLGIDTANFHLHTDREGVTEGTRKAVAALYDELWDQTPPTEGSSAVRRGITMAKRMAATKGWAPPLAWDDDEIDDPDCTPHPIDGRDRGIDPSDLELVLEEYNTLDNAAARFGIRRASLLRHMERHGIEVPTRIRVAETELQSVTRRRTAA